MEKKNDEAFAQKLPALIRQPMVRNFAVTEQLRAIEKTSTIFLLGKLSANSAR